MRGRRDTQEGGRRLHHGAFQKWTEVVGTLARSTQTKKNKGERSKIPISTDLCAYLAYW